MDLDVRITTSRTGNSELASIYQEMDTKNPKYQFSPSHRGEDSSLSLTESRKLRLNMHSSPTEASWPVVFAGVVMAPVT
ncbi:hypothetical protein MMC17_003460 [Xylographa soralifera]|nr:hypothetical protein [Xylographa soralifera]